MYLESIVELLRLKTLGSDPTMAPHCQQALALAIFTMILAKELFFKVHSWPHLSNPQHKRAILDGLLFALGSAGSGLGVSFVMGVSLILSRGIDPSSLLFLVLTFPMQIATSIVVYSIFSWARHVDVRKMMKQ